MADSPSAATESNSQPQEPENRVSDMNQTDSVPSQLQSSGSASIPVAANPNLNPPLISPPQPPLSFAPPPAAPSFRPLPLSTQQFPPILNPGFSNVNYMNPGIQPPGVSSAGPGLISGSVSAPQQMMPYQVFPGQAPNPAMRPYAPIPNGYATIPAAVPQGTIPPSGVPRFTSPYASVVRGPFLPRPPGAIGIIPTVSRPLLPGVPGIRPMMPLVMRPVIPPSVTPAELPQTTIYIGRIAQTVENDFMLSLLQLCGPVKSWKRVQDPTNGTPRAFGFCEFESAEGVLRAIRLLTNFNVDGQELKLKGTQATRKYLRQYVEKKIENSKKLKETQDGEAKEEDGSAVVAEKSDTVKSVVDDSKEDNDPGEKEDREIAISAIVSNEDKEADREALQKLTSSIEVRLKTRPLPQPPAQAVDDPSGNADASAKMRDGDSDGDVTRSDAVDDKNNDTEDIKQTSDHDRPETSSPERSRRYDRRNRERDRERDVKREKEREIERYERETERERIRKEREQRRKVEEAERQYEECLKEWEYREREKEKQRQYERDREKERERKRKKEIIYDEDDEDDDSRKKWRRSVLEEKRKKKLREKEDDLADIQKEKEDIAEAMRRADEEQKQKQQREALKLLSVEVVHDDVKTVLAEESSVEIKDKVVDQHFEGDTVCENHMGFESTLVSGASDQQHSGNGPTRRLGFGLVGSGKRTAVPSVFHEEDDDEAHKEKKMRPLVPIDYSAEELEAVQPPTSGVQPPNLAAAAEFAKRISNANTKEEKSNEKERVRRSSDKPSYRDKDRNDEEVHRKKDENRSFDRERDRDRDRVFDKLKTPDNKKLLDAKQLIDMIPKTKEELFSYEINWAIYDKHELQERMRPWISKKITEFLGEEEATLVDYIVSSTQEHVKASQMLELLQSILDEEAEMFVLKMWRMLIFEIKKVETGIASRSKA